MALYLTRFSYTPESWARLTKNPEDRRRVAREVHRVSRGKLHGFWYAFGTYTATTSGKHQTTCLWPQSR